LNHLRRGIAHHARRAFGAVRSLRARRVKRNEPFTIPAELPPRFAAKPLFRRPHARAGPCI